MVKRLLISIFATAVLSQVPAEVGATEVYSPAVETALQEELTVTIRYSEGILYVNGAEGQLMEVVSLTGKEVLKTRIDSPAQRIEISLPKGCYIVKIGDVARKISVR